MATYRNFKRPFRLTFNGAPFGYEQLVQLIRTFREAFPDLHLTIEEQMVASHHVITRGTFRGTHHGAWFGVAPTGKRVTWPAIAIDRIAQGKVVEMWHVADVLGVLHQLGTVPSDLVIQEEDAG
ncbi:MAG: ester cyclase [Candidatus Tectomicrobia bacterium]